MAPYSTDPVPDPAGAPYRLAGGRLTIDLGAIVANWKALASACKPAATAAVVKADAYGLGADRVGPALAEAGCDTFFVAMPEEGIALRAAVPDARIFVLAPLLGDGAEHDMIEHRLIPVLNSTAEIAVWESLCGSHGAALACAIHVDTGMNRLGLTVTEALSFAEENALTRAIEPVLLMSHLACADEPRHPLNRRQFESFQAVRAAFGEIESSLANSPGIFLGRHYHFDLTRPGIALYGGKPRGGSRNPMRTVATVEARITQIRHARAGDAVSYGATPLRRDSVIAVCACGYADGLPRSLAGAGVPLRETVIEGGLGFVAGRRVPLLGRVTMDLMMFDVSDCEEGMVTRGDWIELFGPNIAIDDAAATAGTIAYELLTGLGRRYHRRYLGGAGEIG